jgi:hypothetical protein
MNWINIKDQLPPHTSSVVFWFDGEPHFGGLTQADHSRPVKWVWFCEECKQMDMEELAMDKPGIKPVKFWFLPKDPYESEAP